MPAKGSAEWKGDVPTGTGTFTAGDTISGGYSYKSRFEDGPGSNPAQLIAAAHAACFSMALSNLLAQAGTPPQSVHTDATVTLRPVDGMPTITAIALRPARDAMQIIVVGRDAARGAAVAEQIKTEGGQATFIAADLSDPAEIARLACEAGDIDVLVNNAGFSVWAPTEKMAVEDFDAMFASNVRAPFLLVGAFAPAMAAKGAGSIINITSMAGRIGLPSGAAYGATKAALDSMTQSWTAEYSPRGVRVNAIAAGPIYTRPESRERYDKLGATTAL